MANYGTSPNTHDSSSTNGKSPAAPGLSLEDMRYPDRPQPTPAPSIRSESPRQSQYALRNIELQTRESRQLPSYFEEHPSQNAQLQGTQPGEGWNANLRQDAPTGLNPLVGNNINVNLFDVNMADNSNQSRSTSTGLTPGSSSTYRSTSNTSYSPPQVEDEVTRSAQQQAWNNAITPPIDSIFVGPSTFNSQSPNGIAAVNQNDPFKVPPGWETDVGNTPGFSGLTPDGGWDKMIQDAGLIWDEQRNGMTPK